MEAVVALCLGHEENSGASCPTLVLSRSPTIAPLKIMYRPRYVLREASSWNGRQRSMIGLLGLFEAVR